MSGVSGDVDEDVAVRAQRRQRVVGLHAVALGHRDGHAEPDVEHADHLDRADALDGALLEELESLEVVLGLVAGPNDANVHNIWHDVTPSLSHANAPKCARFLPRGGCAAGSCPLGESNPLIPVRGFWPPGVVAPRGLRDVRGRPPPACSAWGHRRDGAFPNLALVTSGVARDIRGLRLGVLLPVISADGVLVSLPLSSNYLLLGHVSSAIGFAERRRVMRSPFGGEISRLEQIIDPAGGRFAEWDIPR